MTPLVPIALVGWLLASLLLFAVLPARRALVATFVGALLFLPVHTYDVPGLPPYSRQTVAALAGLVGTLIAAPARLRALRFGLVDVPLLVWCLCPIPSSLANGLGWNEGLSGALEQVVAWGIPYALGKAYFRKPEDLLDLVGGIVAGGLLYVPLCWFEVVMSPQLHRLVYGFHQHSFAQTVRFGAYRPMVFMDHGLMVGVWMCSASVLAVWALWSRRRRTCLGLPLAVVALALIVTTVGCRSLNGILLLLLGLATLFLLRRSRRALPLALLWLLGPLYVSVRASGSWDAQQLVTVARTLHEGRAQSLAFRIDSENLLLERAWQRPWLGWGRWGRSRIHDEEGRDVTIVDGQWIVTLGQYGLLGLLAQCGVLLAPVLRVLRSRPRDPAFHPAVAISLLLLLAFLDSLLNAFPNPVYTLGAGGLAGIPVLLLGAGARRTSLPAGPSARGAFTCEA